MTQTSSGSIGILTLPFNGNYGGIIQAVALYQFLARNGGAPVVIRKWPWRPWWKRPIMWALQNVPGQNLRGVRGYKLWMRPFESWMKEVMPRQTGDIRGRTAMTRVARRLDAVVVGSDQVWRQDFHSDHAFLNYFLDFVPDGTRRVSYAASFGHSDWPLPALTETVSQLLARFDAVSVREDRGVAICNETFGFGQATHVLDPTLLMDASFYNELIRAGDRAADSKPAQPVLLKYLLDDTPATVGLEARVQAQHGDTLTPREIRNGEVGHAAGITLPQWLRAFRDADYVLTDSFHGMVFSIINRKNFYAFGNRFRGLDRFASLLRLLDLEDRLILDAENLPEPSPIDYERVGKRLDELRAASAQFVLEATGLNGGPTGGLNGGQSGIRKR